MLAYRCAEPLLSWNPKKGRADIGLELSLIKREMPGRYPPFLFPPDQRPSVIAFAMGWGRLGIENEPRMAAHWYCTFEIDIWNLRAAVAHIVDRPYGRFELMGPQAKVALAALMEDLDLWYVSSSTSREADAIFVREARTLLDDISRPLFLGMFEPAIMQMAISSLAACGLLDGTEASMIGIEADEELANFSF